MTFYRVWGSLVVAAAGCFAASAVSHTPLLRSAAVWLLAAAGLLYLAVQGRRRLRLRRLDPLEPGPGAAFLARHIYTEADVAGVSVVVLRDGEADWGSAGRSGRRGLAVNAETRFEIGSLTKVFTGLLLAESVVRGEVSLDDPVGRYLPGVVTDPAGTVTLQALATHTSGLPRLPRSARLYLRRSDPYRGLDSRWLARVGPRTPVREPGFTYSNLGYMILGEALAAATGSSWAALVDERIGTVLGMTATTVYPDAHTARGHDQLGLPAAYWHMSALPGAGALYSTAADLRLFLDAQLHPADTALGEAIKLTRQPHGPQGAGLGWVLDPAADIAWHNGGTGGFSAFMAVRSRRNAAVAVLANSSHAAKLDQLAMGYLRPL